MAFATIPFTEPFQPAWTAAISRLAQQYRHAIGGEHAYCYIRESCDKRVDIGRWSRRNAVDNGDVGAVGLPRRDDVFCAEQSAQALEAIIDVRRVVARISAAVELGVGRKAVGSAALC